MRLCNPLTRWGVDHGRLGSRDLHDAFLRGVFGQELACDNPFPKNNDSIRSADEFRQFGRDHYDGRSFLRKACDHGVNFGFRLNVHPLRRLIKNEDPGLGREPLRENDLLLIASRKLLHELIVAAASHPEAIQVRLDESKFTRAFNETKRGRLVYHGQNGIGQDGKIHHQALSHPIFRHVGYAHVHRVLGRSKGNLFSVQQNLSGRRLVDSK